MHAEPVTMDDAKLIERLRLYAARATGRIYVADLAAAADAVERLTAEAVEMEQHYFSLQNTCAEAEADRDRLAAALREIADRIDDATQDFRWREIRDTARAALAAVVGEDG